MAKEKRKFSKQPPALPRKSESFNATGRHAHKSGKAPAASGGGQYWLYGRHAVEAATGNKERRIARLLVSPAASERLVATRPGLNAQTVEPSELDRLLGANAVHQGIAAQVQPLEPYVLEDILHQENPSGPVLVLDQVSDPQNVGAILRSAAAFGACALLAPKDHSAPESAAMAKAACGAVDIVPRVTVTNLASSFRELKAAGWWIVGLDGEAPAMLHDLKFSAKTVLVLGAEGKGMRRLTAELCDELAKLPIAPQMESLNVSNAAAIALYHLAMSRARHG